MKNGKRQRANIYTKKEDLENVIKRLKIESDKEEKIVQKEKVVMPIVFSNNKDDNSVTESEQEDEKYTNLNIERSEKFFELKDNIKKHVENVEKKRKRYKIRNKETGEVYDILNEKELLSCVINRIITVKKFSHGVFVYICIKKGSDEEKKCLVDRDIFKKHFPYMLLDFYESKIVYN